MFLAYIKILKNKINVMCIGASIMLCVFPVLFLYFSNAGEADFSEILVPFFISITIALVLYSTGTAIMKCQVKASIMTIVLGSIIFNYAILETGIQIIFNHLWYWHVLPILVIIALHLIYFLCYKINNDIREIIVLVSMIVVGGLLVFNAVLALPQIVNKISVNMDKTNKEMSSEDLGLVTEMENIYILVWDEFASFNQMEDYFGYDNTELKDFFEDNNFTNSYYSYNEYPATNIVMTNMMSLDYLVDTSSSESDMEIIRHNGELFSLLSSYGYELDKYTVRNFYGEGPLTISEAQAASISGETMAQLFFQATVFYPLLSESYSDSLEEELYIVEYLSDENNIPEPESSTFTIMHVVIPHEPFCFDEDGNRLSYNEALNWKDKSIYTGQYKYASTLMMDQLEVILEKDPNSMIIVMSDHGARAHSDSEVSATITFEQKTNILNAFYYKGGDYSEYADQSSVNTLRLMLNEVLGTDFEEVEVPNLNE